MSSASRASAVAVWISAGVVVLGGCGGSDTTSSDTTTTSSSSAGQVRFAWQEPGVAEDQLGYEVLKASETEKVTMELAKAFSLPHPLLVRGVNGYGEGPYYSGRDNSITLPYGFFAMVAEVMAEGEPNAAEEEIEEQVIGVSTFVLAHEFAHALVENLELPVLGKEEDAADAISTALLLEVPGGDEYAADAAVFWAELSDVGESHDLAEYADSHSLDIQRALNIACWVAGSSRESYEEVAELGVLPASRLETCPAEYEQLVESIEKELGPHLRSG